MIYGYLRVSSDDQDVNNQRKGVEELAAKNGWTVDGWISDEGVSGTKEPEKRQLGKLMKKCKPGDIIICSELSRLGRRMLMVMSILEYCMKNNIMIYTVKDNYVLGDNIQSTVLAFAFSLASQIERDMIALRTKEALAVRKKSGVILGAPRNMKKIATVNDTTQKEMEALAEDGKSLVFIARKMKLHRLTVGYYLAKSKTFKGNLDGYNIEYCNGEKITLTKRNCTEYGLYYEHIKNAYNEGKDMSFIGIKSIEPKYRHYSKEYSRERYAKSDNPNIDRDLVEKFVLLDMTIPEIYNKIGSEKVTYDDVYDYIAEDTYLSNEYRLKGQLKCKSKRYLNGR